MNRQTNKFHRDLRHPTKKEMDTNMNEKTKELQTIQSEWKNYEVAISMEGNVRLVEEKLVMEITTGYLPLDKADCFQREQDAWNHFYNAHKVLIELDRIKQYTENGVKLKVDFDLHGLSWGWEGRQDMETRYETKEEGYKI